MKKLTFLLLVLFSAHIASCFADTQLKRRPLEASELHLDTPDNNFVRVSIPSPVLPQNLPSQFNEGVITATEIFHGQLIGDLRGRVDALENLGNKARGAIWALGIIGTSLVGLGGFILGIFWRGIFTVIFNEVSPRILRP